MEPEQIKRIGELVDEALVEEYGVRWRELVPILIRRIPELLAEIRSRGAENQNLRQQLDSFNDVLREKNEILQEFEAAHRMVRNSLDALWDESLSATEALVGAVQSMARDLQRTLLERDVTENDLQNARQVVGEQAAQIDRLQDSAELLIRTQKEAAELQQYVDDFRLKASLADARIADLEASVLTAEERFDGLREKFDEQVETIREDLRIAQSALNTALQDVESWKDRAQQAEQRANELASHIEGIEVSLQQALRR